MKMPKRGEKGFTLIELLIVVAILGVLAAIVIPNVGRFIGSGEEEAKETEFQTVQSAVHSMMVDNELQTLPTPVETATHAATNDMELFPDTSAGAAKGTDTNGVAFDGSDKAGWCLYQCDIQANSNATANLTNYVATQTTSYYYRSDQYGTIRQYDTAVAIGSES